VPVRSDSEENSYYQLPNSTGNNLVIKSVPLCINYILGPIAAKSRVQICYEAVNEIGKNCCTIGPKKLRSDSVRSDPGRVRSDSEEKKLLGPIPS